MKINETNRIGAANLYQKQNDIRNTDSRITKKKDEVQISAAAKEMLSTSKLNGAERAQYIADLKHSVTTGTYNVKAEQIAEKLLPYFKNQTP